MVDLGVGGRPLLHGHDLLEQGLTVSQVVHDYGDVCQAITDLAVELEAPIESVDFRTLNACLDYARNLPGVGCVFTIDLPRAHVAEPALR